MLQSKPCLLFVIRSGKPYRIVQEKTHNDYNELSQELRGCRDIGGKVDDEGGLLQWEVMGRGGWGECCCLERGQYLSCLCREICCELLSFEAWVDI